MPPSFSPIEAPPDLPAHWSGPLRDRCREVLVQARQHPVPHGTIDKLVYYCRVVINWLGDDPRQTVDFCREFGIHAVFEMNDLMRRILDTNIHDESERHRLARKILASRQWREFLERVVEAPVGRMRDKAVEKPVEPEWSEWLFPARTQVAKPDWWQRVPAAGARAAVEETPAAARPRAAHQDPCSQSKRELARAGDFRHGPGYQDISFRDKQGTLRNCTLTPMQASIVRHLHEAHERGTPWVSSAALIEAAESRTKRFRDIFRNSGLWKTLIIHGPDRGKRKGTYRLDLPDPARPNSSQPTRPR